MKKEFRKRSLGETIMELIRIYKEIKASNFVNEVREIRSVGINDVKSEINKLRKSRWAKL